MTARRLKRCATGPPYRSSSAPARLLTEELQAVELLPLSGKDLPYSYGVQHRRACLPVSVFDTAVLHVKWVSCCRGTVDQLVCRRLIVESDPHPYILERIGYLPEQVMDGFETIGQYIVDAILDRSSVAQIRNPHLTL